MCMCNFYGNRSNVQSIQSTRCYTRMKNHEKVTKKICNSSVCVCVCMSGCMRDCDSDYYTSLYKCVESADTHTVDFDVE